MRTPAILVSLIIANYVFQEFFQLIGLDLIGSIFSFVLVLGIVALSTWTYSRYSGNFREASHKIDETVQWGWQNIFSNFVKNSKVGQTIEMVQHLNNVSNKIIKILITLFLVYVRINSRNKKTVII